LQKRENKKYSHASSVALGTNEKKNEKIISKFKEQGVHLFFKLNHVAMF